MTNIDNFNDQSAAEELFNVLSHGFGAALAVAGTVILILRSRLRGDAAGVAGASVYGFSLIFLYLMSTLYHAISNRRVKRVFQVFDHCSIFVLILGSYTPICLSLLRGALGWTLFGINALLTLIGVIANAVNIKRWHRLSLALYLLMGWSVLFAIRPLLQIIPPRGFALLLAGGLCYSFGVLFYRAEKPRFMHLIWHLLVLCGSAFHYFFILFFVF